MNSTLHLNRDQNAQKFDSLSIDDQKLLLDFYVLGTERCKKLMLINKEHPHNFQINNLIYNESNTLQSADDSDLLDEFLERNWSRSESAEIFDHIIESFSPYVEDVTYMLDQLSNREIKDVMRHLANDNERPLIFSDNLYQRYKNEMFLKLNEKYSYTELEEKLSHLL